MMTIDDRLEIAAARCVEIMKRYHESGPNRQSREHMVAEVHLVVGYLHEFQPPPQAVLDGILEPIESYLLGRFGYETGCRLNAEFVQAFESVGLHLIARNPRIY